MSLGNKEKKNIKKLAKSVTHKVSMAINSVFKRQPHENFVKDNLTAKQLNFFVVFKIFCCILKMIFDEFSKKNSLKFLGKTSRL